MLTLLTKLANPFMTFILRSPLHSLVSQNVMLITVTGRKSGKMYTTPVNYVREDNTFLVISLRERTWWKNLRGGSRVTVRLQGQDLKGTGQALEDPEAVASGLLLILRQAPALRKHFQLDLRADGQPTDPDALAWLAQDRVIVRVTELAPPSLKEN
jgi:deazaflavin-dependent oxidoreductase (nitroreductase family)